MNLKFYYQRQIYLGFNTNTFISRISAISLIRKQMHLKYEKLDEIAITHKNNYTGNKSYLNINIYIYIILSKYIPGI